MVMRNNGAELERHVQFVFDTLLNFKGNEHTVVTTGAVLQGRSGNRYKADVFYEFERAGIRHRVVIECKNYTTRRVEAAEVIEFKGKIEEVGQVVGVMVSKSGYQQGAIDYARHYYILLLRENELPTIGSLLADRISAATMPDESCIGEPFWTWMQIRNGEPTGSYFSTRGEDGIYRIPLFISKSHCEYFLKRFGYSDSYAVRGLPQRVLRGLIITARSKKAEVAMMYQLPESAQAEMIARYMTLDELRNEFLHIEL